MNVLDDYKSLVYHRCHEQRTEKLERLEGPQIVAVILVYPLRSSGLTCLLGPFNALQISIEILAVIAWSQNSVY